jgi:hypothetical protein
MKAVFVIMAIVFTGFMACDTPEPTTTNPSDSTTINSARPDSAMQNTDTTVRRDSVPGR